MTARSVLKWLLLGFVGICVVALAVKSFRPAGQRAKPAGIAATTSADEIASKDRIVAIYFTGRARCTSCVAIERVSRQAIESGFPADVASGRIAMRLVNIELPENAHHTVDFEMPNRTLVLAEYKSGKAIRFEQLDKVWELTDDEKALESYVTGRLRSFIGKR